MSENEYQPVPLQRVPSGIPGLDTILCGGFLKGGIYLIMGPPGVGKTILGNQLSFSHVANSGRVVYVTLLTETHARMLTHLQSMRFFNPAPLANTLYYVSGYTTLEQEGLKGLTTLLRQEMRNHHASLLIIDGLITAREVALSPLEMKQFLHELHVYTETIGCTTLLLTQYDNDQQNRPEFIMVDGLIELNEQIIDMRSIRELEVHKFRGSNCLRGQHLFEINDAGITVHPRTETLVKRQNPIEVPLQQVSQRMSFGVPRLDEMLEGGLPVGSASILLGAPGTGKTLLGLQFLKAGADKGEQGLLFGLNESPLQLERKAQRLNIDIADVLQKGLIELQWQSQREDILDVYAERLLEQVQRLKVRRLFIDGLNGFQQAIATRERLGLFLSALITTLKDQGITTLWAMELPEQTTQATYSPIERVIVLADNCISLRSIELHSQSYRLLSIMKMRDSGYDPAIREFRITPQGIEVATTFQSAEDILTGTARPGVSQQIDFDEEPHTSQEQQL